MDVLTQFGVAPLYDNPTVIDDRAEFVFTMGQCHAFALAVNKLTGWQIVADDDITRGKGHLLIRLPGSLGIFDVQEFHDDPEEWYWHDVTVQQVLDLYEQRMRNWLPPDVDAAMPYATIRAAQMKEKFPQLA